MKDLYTKAAAVAVPLVRGIGDDQLDGPTPCAEYDVRGLANHLFEVAVEFQKSARFEDMDFANSPDYLADAKWRERFAVEVEALSQAWSRPEALVEGEDTPMGFPRALLGRLPAFDLTVHGWDLARSTGQDYPHDEALVEEMYTMAVQFAEKGRQVGQFGAAVAVPESAPVIDRLVGLVGRDPAWKP